MNELLNKQEYFQKEKSYNKKEYIKMVIDYYVETFGIDKEDRLEFSCALRTEDWTFEEAKKRYEEVK